MGIEDKVYEFYEIVPRSRESSSVQSAQEPNVEPLVYPDVVRVNLPPDNPFSPWRKGERQSPFLYVFDRVEEIVDRMKFDSGQRKELIIMMDVPTFQQFWSDIPIISKHYASQRMGPKGFFVENSFCYGYSNSIGDGAYRVVLQKNFP